MRLQLKSFLQKEKLEPMLTRLKESIKNQLTQGVTPEKLSQSLTAGVLIGCFPIIGVSTLLSGLPQIKFLFFFKSTYFW